MWITKAALKITLCGLFLIWAISCSAERAIDLPTFQFDGAFQTASGLYRLNAGQVPGRDFLPYLGIGPTVSLFPVFKFLGSNLAASVTAAHVLTLVLVALEIFMVGFFVLAERQSSIPLIVATLGTVILTHVTGDDRFVRVSGGLSNVISFSIDPGNSLRPIRDSAPFILAAVYYFFVLDIENSFRRSLALGFVSGSCLLWSNDFGIPCAAMFIVLAFLDLIWRGNFCSLNALSVLFVAVASAAMMVTLFTVGHPFPMLEYNFADVANDQWWYFASYLETSRIFTIFDLARLISGYTVLPTLIFLFLVFYALATKSQKLLLVAWIGCVLGLGGAIASIGGHLGGYFIGYSFWAVLVGFFFVLRGSVHLIRLMPSRMITGAVWQMYILNLFALLAMAGLAFGSWRTYRDRYAHERQNPTMFFVPELGGFLANQWRSYIDLARSNKKEVTIEEYWGIWSAVNRSFPPWPVDAVIHALGKTRNRSKGAIDQAEIIITSRYVTSPEWQPWSVTQNFWFYDRVLTGYIPYAMSPTTMVWKRGAAGDVYSPVSCAIDFDGPKVVVGATGPAFYRVSIKYNDASSGRSLLMAQNNFSYADDTDGQASLNPNGHDATYPVYLNHAGQYELRFDIVGSTDAALKLIQCQAYRINFDFIDVLHPPTGTRESFFVTDANWADGISRLWPGFFVSSSQEHMAIYRPRRYVQFADESIRRIRTVRIVGAYLYVYVAGPVLNPSVIGTPSCYTVLDDLPAGGNNALP